MSDAFPCCLDGALGGFSQEQFEFCKDLLDGIEIGRVWRQEDQPGAGGPDGFADGRAFVAAQIVHDDDVAGQEGRHEELLDIGSEGLAVDRAIEDARRVDPVMAERGQEGQRLPMPEGCLGDELLAPGRPAADRRHVRLGPGLVDEDEAPGVNPALICLPLCPPPRDCRPILFDGEQCFF